MTLGDVGFLHVAPRRLGDNLCPLAIAIKLVVSASSVVAGAMASFPLELSRGVLAAETSPLGVGFPLDAVDGAERCFASLANTLRDFHLSSVSP